MKIKSYAEDDRPREKFLQKGRGSVSDSELLAIILRSGNNEESVVDLSRRILDSVNYNWNFLAGLSIDELMKFHGVGEAKAISIAATLEIGKRRAAQSIPEKPQIKKSSTAFKLLHPILGDLKTEEFWCLYLNQTNKVIHLEKLTQGGINHSVVDVRILFKIALEKYATGIIIAHNHPSGNLTPSGEDIAITKKISQAGELLDVSLLDHLIVTQGGYISFNDEGLL